MEHLLNQMIEEISKSYDFSEKEKKESISQLRRIFKKLYGVGLTKADFNRETDIERTVKAILETIRRRPQKNTEELANEVAINFFEKENGYEAIGLVEGIPTKQKLVNFIKASLELKNADEMDAIVKKVTFNKMLDRMVYLLYPHSDYVNKSEFEKIFEGD